MNAKQFKQLIKECVKEAVREELVELFLPKKKMVKENLSFNSDNVIPMNGAGYKNQLAQRMQAEFGNPGMKSDYKLKQAPIPQSVVENNPLAAFIADAAANMSAEDVAGMRNLG